MKRKPSPPIREQDAMARFDRLLATMAPKAEVKRQPPAKPHKARGPKPRRPR